MFLFFPFNLAVVFNVTKTNKYLIVQHSLPHLRTFVLTIPLDSSNGVAMMSPFPLLDRLGTVLAAFLPF